jgi:hypothetical protein
MAWSIFGQNAILMAELRSPSTSRKMEAEPLSFMRDTNNFNFCQNLNRCKPIIWTLLDPPGYFHWHLDAFLLSIALERVIIERFMLARVWLRP